MAASGCCRDRDGGGAGRIAGAGRRALTARVATRYRDGGRFATHYVAGKLRRDPLTAALLELGGTDGFGDVVDVGCGRGQFAGLLLEAGLARSVVGLELRPVLLAQARRALRGLPFAGILRDLTVDATLPPADTVLLLDVLYQLPTEVQRRLLAAAAGSARRLVLVRTADPDRGARAWLSRVLERAARRVWPHSGATVNARPVGSIVQQLSDAGFAVRVTPCWAGTPFANVLLVANGRAPI